MSSVSIQCRSLLQSSVSSTWRGFSFVPSTWSQQIRFASKKATGGNRNPKQAPGNFHGIKKGDGKYVFPGDVLMYRQSRLWFHPGLNVTVGRLFLNLVALKEGTVRITCEKPDLNFENKYVKQFYAGREGRSFYKKYFHVIPQVQHNRFKCIDQI